MQEFSTDQLQILFDAAPQDLFLGFSPVAGDRDCLNTALQNLGDDERELLIAVMKHGSKLHASKEIGGTDLPTIIGVGRRIDSALQNLRVKFDKASETYVPQ